ncbi:class I SAM-dependent methyltransferase [Halioglobus maricola]|uniref:Class I SAM-dependent methyltransferase n=1 Tax=Halioglobus maricola TaxID=2601894 RepID=A0A5P9NF89_9GAMM|nr:class I SAM-dependent methyltransferase [Halioglobus maricola]QFU74432.1 class I SAM-dependent methyltransferase [Halioglobus maricola]
MDLSESTTLPQILSMLYDALDVEPFDSGANTKSLFAEIGHAVPSDTVRIYEAEDLIPELLDATANGMVVDIGCGKGASRAIFQEVAPRMNWLGLEVADTYNKPKVDQIRFFNGHEIPLESNSVDYCYSRQVFEHVRQPEKLLSEIYRVLKKGGIFFGSVSGHEPYHFYSLFNFTPYGWYTILNDAGFEVTRLLPGADGMAVALRHISENKKLFPGIFRGKSWIGDAIESKCSKESVQEKNTRLLIYAAHMSFVAEKG